MNLPEAVNIGDRVVYHGKRIYQGRPLLPSKNLADGTKGTVIYKTRRDFISNALERDHYGYVIEFDCGAVLKFITSYEFRKGVLEVVESDEGLEEFISIWGGD